MNGIRLSVMAGLIVLVATTGAEASGRYLRHPIFQKLPPMEIRVETQWGYGDTGDLPFGVLGAFGIEISESLTAGIYGQFTTSDRDLPYKSDRIYGVGGFAEYAFDLGTALIPYAGLRLGMLDPTGPGSPTLPNAAGYLGVKYPLTQTVSLSGAVTLHWAGDNDGYKAFNYERNGNSYKADNTDVTFDAGLRYAF